MQPIQIGGFDIGTVAIINGEEFAVVESSESAGNRDFAYGQRAICLNKLTWTRDISPSNEHDLSPLTKISGYAEPLTEDRVNDLIIQSDRAISEDRSQLAKEREERELKVKKGKEIFKSLTPSWAKAVIVANKEQNDSDPMSDYYSSKTIEWRLLGFSKHTKDLFSEMRKFALTLEETKHLDSDSCERREKYSMGNGYYLADHRMSGWQVCKYNLNYFNWDLFYINLADGVAMPPKAVSEPVKSGSVSESVEVRFNQEKNGIEIIFPSKPEPSVIESLKANGFRWSSFSKLWWAKQSPKTLAFANQL